MRLAKNDLEQQYPRRVSVDMILMSPYVYFLSTSIGEGRHDALIQPVFWAFKARVQC